MIESKIRNYDPKDKQSLLEILKLNTPTYFSPEEEKDFIHYLDHEIDLYYVLEFNNKIIGCGGINLPKDKNTGVISWGMLHPEFQKKGYGSLLLKHRISELQKIKSVKKIIVRTSQHVFPFYEKAGFKVVKTISNYWAEGFDLVEMEYQLLNSK